jgi:hypothetical protein
MMGGGAFILLKSGPPRPESTKQAEMVVATLPKILRVALSDDEIASLVSEKRHGKVVFEAISAGYG